MSHRHDASRGRIHRNGAVTRRRKDCASAIMSYQPTTSKATTAGQDYEVGLCCLLLLRGQRLCSQFFLACNHGDAGLFDDVVFVYRRRETDVGWRAILVQQKHKEKKTIRLWARQTQVKPGSSKLPSDLAQYCKSFSEIEERWRRFKTDETSTADIEQATYVFYSNSKVDLHGADRDVPTEDITELILTGGRAVKVDYGEVSQEVWGQQLPNSREFLENFVVCCNQVDHKGMEEQLKEEVEMCLNSQSADTWAIVTEVTKFIKKWWEKKFDTPYLTKDSEIWRLIVNKEMMRLNANIYHLSEKYNLFFTSSYRDDVVSFVKTCGQVCLQVRDEAHATMTSIMLYQGVEKSLVLDSDTLKQNEGEVIALWKTPFCNVLVIVDCVSVLQEEMLVQMVNSRTNETEKHLVVLREETARINDWTHYKARATWDVLNSTSKERLLSVAVTFQGQTVALTKLIHENSIMSDAHIARLSAGQTDIVLGVEIPSVPTHYVPRWLEKETLGDLNFVNSLEGDKVIIGTTGIVDLTREKIGYDVIVRDYDNFMSQDIHATTVIRNVNVSNFKNLCVQLNCKGYLIGIEMEPSQYQIYEVLPCIWQAGQRSLIVDGIPGIGKSSFVTWSCFNVKRQFPDAWVLRIDMGKESDFINKREFKSMQDVKAFLAKGYCSKGCSLETDLLNHALEITGNVFIFLDAFDEISPEYTEKCCRLLKGIAEHVKYRQLVVTTRPVTKLDVEETLGSVAFSLPSFNKEEQKYLLEGFCASICTEVNTSKINSVIEAVGPALEVPLICKMTAELIFGNAAKARAYSMLTLYEAFVDRHVSLYLTEKFGLKSSMAGVTQLLEAQKIFLSSQLKDLAVTILLSDEERASIGFRSAGDTLVGNKLSLVVCSGPRVDFVHRTFAEFFLGTWLADHYHQCRNILLGKLFRANYELVTASFNRGLIRGCPFQSAVAEGDLLAVEGMLDSASSTGPGGRTALHIAALSGSGNIAAWKRLVDAGVPLDLEDDVLRWTAVEYAEAVRNWEMVDFLIGAGASASKLRTVKDEGTAKAILRLSATGGLVTLSVHILGLHPNLVTERLDSDKSSVLHHAAASGSVRLVSETLVLGAEVDAVDARGQTPLHRASAETLTVLLQHGADVNRADNCRRTPLHAACATGRAGVVAALLKHGADVNRADKHGKPALHEAASRRGATEVAELLLRAGADVNAAGHTGTTALHEAAETATVALLLRHGADVTRVDRNGITALQRAAGDARTEAVALLLDHGAEADVGDHKGETALHRASAAGSTETAALLLERGADVNRVDHEGDSALLKASMWNRTETVAMLLQPQHGVDVNRANAKGVTALHWASITGGTQKVSLLLQNGADINTTDDKGAVALHWASEFGRTDNAALLLRSGADIKTADNDGRTALHRASREGRTETVALLLRSGADVNEADNRGETALHMASTEGKPQVVPLLVERDSDKYRTETVALLLRLGADVNRLSDDGHTALHKATSAGNAETVALLLRHGAPR